MSDSFLHLSRVIPKNGLTVNGKLISAGPRAPVPCWPGWSIITKLLRKYRVTLEGSMSERPQWGIVGKLNGPNLLDRMIEAGTTSITLNFRGVYYMFVEIYEKDIYSIVHLCRHKFHCSRPFPLPCQGAKGSQVWPAQSLGKKTTKGRKERRQNRAPKQNMVRDEFELGK